MNNFILITLIIVLLLGGCATNTNKAKEVSPIDSLVLNDYGSTKGNNDKLSKDITDRVRRGNDLYTSGQYKEAEKVYQEILAEYSSKDGSFETAVQTNLCMAYIEQGERVKFKYCANKLKESSQYLPYLSRETQMVLELSDSIGNIATTQKDLRIDSRLSNGINETFKEVK